MQLLEGIILQVRFLTCNYVAPHYSPLCSCGPVGLTLQGLLQLMEAEVKVYSRAKDVKLVQKAVDGAKRQYGEISGRDVNITVVGELSDTM